MSKYCGKCDFYDSICIGCDNEDDIEKWLSETDIYFGSPFKDCDAVKIDVKTEYDAAPLYPHIVVVGGSNNGRRVCYLSQKPYYDIEAEEHLDFLVKDIEKAIRSLKRKKLPVTLGAVKGRIYFSGFEEEDVEETIHSMLNGYEPRLLSRGINSYYRKEHYKKLIDLGYSDSAAYLITHYNKQQGGMQ